MDMCLASLDHDAVAEAYGAASHGEPLLSDNDPIGRSALRFSCC